MKILLILTASLAILGCNSTEIKPPTNSILLFNVNEQLLTPPAKLETIDP